LVDFVDNFGQFQTKMLESFALGVWQGWRTPTYFGPLPSRAICGCTGKGLSFDFETNLRFFSRPLGKAKFCKQKRSTLFPWEQDTKLLFFC